ncbi:hypothetical protein BT69DRAFT_1343246 [Atractiella rhizophila]|nr:hypothetical protein BT69DRAFT_1343246 [Atractiella rhizophila]
MGGKDGIERLARDWKRVVRLLRGDTEGVKEFVRTLAREWGRVEVGDVEGEEGGKKVSLKDVVLLFEDLVPEDVTVSKKQSLWGNGGAKGGKKTVVDMENVRMKLEQTDFTYDGTSGTLDATLAFDISLHLIDRPSSPIPFFDSIHVRVKALQLSLSTGSTIKDALFNAALPLLKSSLKTRIGSLVETWLGDNSASKGRDEEKARIKESDEHG